MARKDSNPLSMTELSEYFKDRNDRIFKGEDDNKEGKKKKLLDKGITQRNSRPSLRIQLEPPTNEIDPQNGNSTPDTPWPFSPCPPRLARYYRRPPFTPQSSSSSSGCSCCFSPFDSGPRFETFLLSPSTTSTSGCSCSSPCYESSPRPLEGLQHYPFTMYGKGNYETGCCCHFFPVYKQTTPTFGQSLPQSQPLSPTYSTSPSPYSSPRQVPQTTISRFALLGNSKMAPQPQSTIANGYLCPQSPLRQQSRGRRRCSFPVSPRPPNEDPYQPKMVRSLPCSPKTTSGSIPQIYLAPQPPLLRKRQQMKNESLLRKPVKNELADCEDEEVLYQELLFNDFN